MAWSTVETSIQNPASGRGKARKMAGRKRKMSAKQIKHFGTARQKAALKASRKRKRTASVKRHRPATKKRSNPTRRRAVTRKRNSHRPATKRRRAKRNPGEIVSFVLGNPSKRSKKVAAKRRRRKAGARRSNPAGRSRKRVAYMRKRGGHRRRSNPGPIGNPKTWIVGGAGVLAGVFVTRGLPQIVLGSSNTGPMGYAANAATAAIAGYAANMVFKNPTITAGVVAGGFAALLARVISDYTPYGKALALSGWGDYQFSNIVGTVPQRVINMNSAVTEWGGPGNANLAMSRGGSDLGRFGSSC